MKLFHTKKALAAIALASAFIAPLTAVAPAQASTRAVCSHDRKSVSPCTQSVAATAGSAITATQSLVTRGLSSHVAFALQRQTLPAGLTLNAQTGVVSGTPTTESAARTYFIYVSSGSNPRRLSATGLVASVTITVNPAISSFMITYDSNSAQSGLASTSLTQGGSGSVPIASNVYTATNSAHFYGWNTQADGKGTFYFPADSFTLNANTTLYAIWYFNVTITATNLWPGENGTQPAAAWVKATLVSDPTSEVLATSLTIGESKIIKVIPYSTTPISIYFTGTYPEPLITLTNVSDFTGSGMQQISDLSGVGGTGNGILLQVDNPTSDGSVDLDTPIYA